MKKIEISEKFNCSKLHKKCDAKCCGCFPMEEMLYRAHEDKRIAPVINEVPFAGGLIMPVTHDQKCCFLDVDYKCAIHEFRPEICRVYGDESDIMMTCSFQDKDGRNRSKQEIKKLESKKTKYIKGSVERQKQKMHKAMKDAEFIKSLKLKEDGDK